MNNIDTIPDRPRPSANIYLKKDFYIKLLHESRTFIEQERMAWEILTRNMEKEQIDSTPSSED